MTFIQVCALISIIIACAILYWTGYRGGLEDGRVDGYENGQAEGFSLGFEQAKGQCALSITQAHEERQRIELLLSREPQDRLTLLMIAEKLKLAAETFKAVRSETHAAQTLVLCEKTLKMAASMDLRAQRNAA
jgi:hypothetical protein